MFLGSLLIVAAPYIYRCFVSFCIDVLCLSVDVQHAGAHTATHTAKHTAKHTATHTTTHTATHTTTHTATHPHAQTSVDVCVFTDICVFSCVMTRRSLLEVHTEVEEDGGGGREVQQ